jgi:tetratricopeptide (TPR) repeat protein/predicted Ser/Thr protein kinase
MIGKTVSHYRILDKLGEGGMGVVYKAEDTKLRRIVALKFLPPQSLGTDEEKARFVLEAQAAAALNHPNICTIHEIDEADGQTFIAMEYVEGLTLRERVSSGPLKLDEAIGIASQTAEALNKAHEKGVIHRDVKSGNIMVTSDGQVKIMDFGLAKLGGESKLTKTGTTVGTVAYMSPEQARGDATDGRTDVWSLGIVLYEMLTGLLPFRRDYEQATVYSILNEEPEPVTSLRAGVPMEVERIIGKALDKDLETRYQSAAEMVADLKRAKRGSDSAAATAATAATSVATATVPTPTGPKVRPAQPDTSTTIRGPQRGTLRKYIVPASIVAIVLFLVLVLKPWKFELSPSQEAVAEENSLAIMYFDNVAEPDDPRKLGEIATNLLITDLSESRYVRVVSGQRLYDILKSLGREGAKVIDREVASQVAEKAQAKWMLLGSILQVEPRVVITAQIVDVASGKAVASQRISGEPDEDIFTLVDRLTVQVKEDLSLPTAAGAETDRRVADVTTHSADAYRHYLEGKEYFHKYFSDDATRSFNRAVELDSTFAMAYYGLSLTLPTSSARKEAIARAVEHLDNVSTKERHFILARQALYSNDVELAIRELESIVDEYPGEKEAYFRLARIYQEKNDAEKTIAMLLKTIEKDPLFKDAYNVLAYQLNYVGEFERSIWAINKYIELAPDEPNPYDSRGDLYAQNGKLPEAIASFRRALEVDPGYAASIENLGDMYLFNGEYARAESLFQALASHSSRHTRNAGRTKLVGVAIYQGKFQRALRMLDMAIETDRIELDEGSSLAGKIGMQSGIHEYLGDFESAISEAEKARDMMRRAELNHPLVLLAIGRVPGLYARKGEFQKADVLMADMEKHFAESDSAWAAFYLMMQGSFAFWKGDLEAAASYGEASMQLLPIFATKARMGLCYAGLGRVGDAVAMYQEALVTYDESRATDVIATVLVHYWLGMAYEESGWNDKAIRQYETFLDIWKDADPGLPDVEDAKARLVRLRSIS